MIETDITVSAQVKILIAVAASYSVKIVTETFCYRRSDKVLFITLQNIDNSSGQCFGGNNNFNSINFAIF